MGEKIVTVAELEKDFDKYINMVIAGTTIIITNDGKEVGRLMPTSDEISDPMNSLTGILHCDSAEDKREKAIKKKYELAE